MKRYKAISFEYDGAYGSTGTALDIIEHPEGEWIKYDDIKHLLKNTSHNSDYSKCSKDVLSYLKYSPDSKAGRDIIDIIKKHFA